MLGHRIGGAKDGVVTRIGLDTAARAAAAQGAIGHVVHMAEFGADIGRC